MARNKNKLTATSINSRLESLEPKLILIAKRVAKLMPAGEQCWEDLYQTILKALLEREVKDPTFFQQTDAYINKYAMFSAKHAAKKARVYLNYVDEEGGEIDPEDSNEDTNSRLDLEASREKLIQSIARVEIEVMHTELADAIVEGSKELSGDNLRVLYLLYLGYKQVEIAEVMGVSKPAISQRVKTIASTLSGFVQGY
jgi:RNA polymerase sigma factor (sigma-70 family)